jgi:hypothetical protein
MVIDSLGQADLLPDQVMVTVLNQPPIADAGPDKRAAFGATVSLDASGSHDPDHDTPLAYYWSQTGGPTVKLSSATAQKPTFVAPHEQTVLTFTLSVSDTFGEPDLTPDEIVIDVRTFFAYMPFVTHQYVAAPDLVVQSITARSNSVQLVIANQGNAPVQNEFWVDVYLNPQTAPTRVNQTWFDLGDRGLAWGVTESALPQLVPGGSLTLTASASTSDAYYVPDLSAVSWPLSPGTTVYAQADSYNPTSSYGNVYETHELLGGVYNNIRGPISSVASTTAIEVPFIADQEPVSLSNLPPRP